MKRWLACVAFVACSSPPPAPVVASARPATFAWSTPADWKKETIPFPLDFAPGLPYRAGSEELRFAPGFFDPTAAGSWSYAFVWFVDRDESRLPSFNAPALEQQLRDYFVGLTKAVASDAKDGWQPALDRVDVHLTGTGTFDGTIRTIDAFKTRNEVNLLVHATSGTCGAKQFLLVAASPKPKGDPMWASLDSVTAAFHCR